RRGRSRAIPAARAGKSDGHIECVRRVVNPPCGAVVRGDPDVAADLRGERAAHAVQRGLDSCGRWVNALDVPVVLDGPPQRTIGEHDEVLAFLFLRPGCDQRLDGLSGAGIYLE